MINLAVIIGKMGTALKQLLSTQIISYSVFQKSFILLIGSF